LPTKRILLADDDRLVLATLAKGLRNAGYEVHVCDSGEAALAAAEQESFELAVLDIRMPGLSGIETARRLRDQHNIPALFLSAYGERELVEQAIADGGLCYVVKPIDAAQLIPAVETALARAKDLSALLQTKAHLERALAGGRYTSMAIGICMERLGLTEQAAFEMLRANARKNRRKLEELCRETVGAVQRLNDI